MLRSWCAHRTLIRRSTLEHDRTPGNRRTPARSKARPAGIEPATFATQAMLYLLSYGNAT